MSVMEVRFLEHKRRSKIFLAIAILALIQSILRLMFFYLGTYGGAQLISPSPPAPVMEFINTFSLALGLGGLAVIPALLLFRNWGYWGTLFLCILTIAFDAWGVTMIAWTAAAGLLIPIVALVYLVPRHVTLFAGNADG